MKDITFITGNQKKADYLAKWLEHPVPHHKLDLDEVQSLDLRIVTEHKARQAFEVLRTPVLVEDVALTFTAMGRLPGTLIKWFLEELGNEGLCKLAARLEHPKAIASICYALFDGGHVEFFEYSGNGQIAAAPRGDGGFGWNPVFVPEGSSKTYAEMDEAEFRSYNIRAHAIEKLHDFLQSR